jgi:hypothetical protein
MKPAWIIVALTLALAACNPAAPSPTTSRPEAALPYERAGEFLWDEEAGAFLFESRPLIAGRSWNFDQGVQALTGQGATVTFSPINGTQVVHDVMDAMVRSPDGLGLNGARFNLVLIRLGREAAGAPWDGSLFWSTDAHGELDAFHAKPFAGSDPAVNETVILAYDMTQPVKGGTDWTTSVVRQLRFDADDGAGGRFRIRQMAIVENPAPERLRTAEGVDRTPPRAAAVGLR